VSWTKPADMFDRVFEWEELSRFASNDASRATAGIVSGRRRQGKTFILDALTVGARGFMSTAAETTEADSLHQFGKALAAHVDESVPFRFAGWGEAITGLTRIAADGPKPVVIDELPFSPRLLLLLCGSALSFMGILLASSAPPPPVGTLAT
jgi:uncharacterized protein